MKRWFRWLGGVVGAVALLGVSAMKMCAGEITLQCSAERYALRDSVIMVLTNETDSVLVVGFRPGFLLRVSDTGDTIAPHMSLPVEWTLDPHRSQRMGWDQLDSSDQWAAPGTYRAILCYSIMPDYLAGACVGADFEIYDPLPTQATSWGRLKWESRPR
jgi:hypothetical protein